jgi:ADP-heptose:LPS heptosyltransferase
VSSNKHKQALVFFSAGVGDAILLVPLVNDLKKNGYKVTGLFTSPYNCESIFENTRLLDAFEIKKNKLSLIIFSILSLRKFDAVFLNHFSFSKSHLILSTLFGKQIYTNYKEFTSAQSSNSIHFIEPKANTHDALQNMLLFNQQATLNDINFNLNYTSKQENKFNLPKDYIVIQASSANNAAPYKNWPFENWITLFKQIQERFPTITLVLLGDHTETHLNNAINVKDFPNVITLIGKTSLNDVMSIINCSKFYFGLDSGLMHIAVALNKPTITIWGASNPKLYGYDWMGAKHKIVSLNLSCAPCSSWLNANKSRVLNPFQCPDFKCIKSISVEMVSEGLADFIKLI